MKNSLDSVAGACCVAPAMAPQEVDEPVLWALAAALSALLALSWLA